MTRESKRGYGQPPKEHQFKKGSSGNPGGRPKRKTHFEVGANMDPEIAELILAEASRPVSIRENGKSQDLSTKAALLRSLNHSGLKGDLRSQIEALKLVLAAERFIAEQKSPRTSGCPRCSEFQNMSEEDLMDRMREMLGTGRVHLPDGWELVENDDEDDHSDLA